MSTGEDRCAVGCDVAFRALGGTVLVRIEEVAVRRDAGGPQAVLVELMAGETAWARIDAGALLHLDPGARGSTLSAAFSGPEPVRVDAVLDRIVTLGLEDPGAATIGARLREAAAGDPLLDARSWWALSVTQRVAAPPGSIGEIHVGMRTAWTDDPPPAGMAGVLALALEGEGVATTVEATAGGDWIVRFDDRVASGLAVAREATREAIVYLALPRRCPPEHIAELARLAALVNFDLPVGCLEADHESGQVRVRASVDVTGEALTLAGAGNLARTVRRLAAAWFPAAERVMDGTPADTALATT